MDQRAIERVIQAEMNEFQMKPYPGILPVWFLEKFPAAIMEMPQIDVPYRGETVQSILNKNTETLTFFEVGLICNVLLSISPKYLDSKIEKYLLKKRVLEDIRTQWNELNNKETERLKRKAASFNEANRPRIIRNN